MSTAQTAARRQVLGDVIPGTWLRDAALVVGYAGLVGLLAQVVIPLPFTPVPITGQTFGVLLGGMALGWRRGLLGMALYTAAGLAGVPWSAQGHGGLAILSLPSFGYIVGFLVAAGAVGLAAGHGFSKTPVLTLVAMAAGTAVIYVFGVGWLMASLHVDLGKALAFGLYPFLLGDAIKALLAAAILPATWRLVGRD